jgi:hypothetical protein
MSGRVELYEHLDVPGPKALAILMGIVQDIAENRPPYDRTALAIGLVSAGPLRKVTPSVPVDVEAIFKPDRYECDVEIVAQAAPTLFPRFIGTMSISPLRASGCELWLQGTYKAPLGTVGDALDATILNGVARKSLKRFVGWMAGEIKRLAASP